MGLAPFIDTIDEHVLVCDGAMGTRLYSRGVFINRCFDGLNLTQPDLVSDVHLEYIRAGADVIETNTFGANRIKLGSFGLSDKLHAINVQGVRIARHAAREQVYVAGAIGPLGVRIEPWGRMGVDEAEAYFREQAQALLDGGVDLFIVETFRDLNEVRAAIRAIRGLSDLPVVAQMTIEEDGNSLDGTPPEEFAPALAATGAAVVGLNCSVGPAPILESIERMAAVTTARLSAQPNAGRPRDIEGRTLYLSSPEYLASYARRLVQVGVRLVGGCCGTTPEHIRHVKAAVRTLSPGRGRSTVTPIARPTAPVHPPMAPPTPTAEKSRLSSALARGKFVVLAELTPPRGHESGVLVDQARTLRIRGVDAINIPDSPLLRASTSALAAAVIVEQRAGVETLLHYTCRDHRLLGMQRDLLGAHAMGVRNLLITTGDPQRMDEFQDATLTFDADSIGLTNVVTRLNQGSDIGGQPVLPPTAFHVGAAVNHSALNPDEEVRRLRYKVEAGAEFVITHPVFDAGDLAAFIERAGGIPVPVIAAVWPLEDARRAEALANEVPGVRVPAGFIQRLLDAEAQGRAAAEGMAIAREIVRAVRPMVQGVEVVVAPARLPALLDVLTVLDD